MTKRRKERLSEGKRNIIAGLIEEYDIKTDEDIQEALKDLLGGTIREMMEAEFDEHLGYEDYERNDNPDCRNGTKPKKLRSTYGEMPIEFPKTEMAILSLKLCQNEKRTYPRLNEKSLLCLQKV